MAVRAEGDQVFQLCFLRLLALAKGVVVVCLDDFAVVVESAGDAGEAVALLGHVREIPHAGVRDAIVSREIHLPPRNQLPIRKPAQSVGSLLRAGNVARGHRIEVFQIGEQAPRIGARILELLIRLLIEGRVGCIEGFHEPLLDLPEAARKIKRLLANRDVAPAVDDDALQELFEDPVGVVGLPVHRMGSVSGFSRFSDPLLSRGCGRRGGGKALHFTRKLHRWIERSQVGDSVIDFNVAEIRWGDLEPIIGTLAGGRECLKGAE